MRACCLEHRMREARQDCPGGPEETCGQGIPGGSSKCEGRESLGESLLLGSKRQTVGPEYE